MQQASEKLPERTMLRKLLMAVSEDLVLDLRDWQGQLRQRVQISGSRGHHMARASLGSHKVQALER